MELFAIIKLVAWVLSELLGDLFILRHRLLPLSTFTHQQSFLPLPSKSKYSVGGVMVCRCELPENIYSILQ